MPGYHIEFNKRVHYKPVPNAPICEKSDEIRLSLVQDISAPSQQISKLIVIPSQRTITSGKIISSGYHHHEFKSNHKNIALLNKPGDGVKRKFSAQCSRMSIIGLILALLGTSGTILFFTNLFIFGVLASLFSILGIRETKMHKETFKGKAWGIIGLILGLAELILFFALIIFK